MLQGLFNYDNPVWRFIGKLGDLIILNVLWIVCSIPIFTIGGLHHGCILCDAENGPGRGGFHDQVLFPLL